MNGFILIINPDSHGEQQLEFTDNPWQAESIFDEAFFDEALALWVFETLIDAGLSVELFWIDYTWPEALFTPVSPDVW